MDEGMKMWADIVKQKDKWIGGFLVDYGDPMDRRMVAAGAMKGPIPLVTEIVDMVLTDTTFEVVGKDFTCGGNRQYIGLSGSPDFIFKSRKDGLCFGVPVTRHEWHIYPKV